MKNKRMFLTLLLQILFAAVLVFFDQLTKYLAASRLKGHPVWLIRNVFSLRYLENRGIGFSLFQGQISLILILNVLILFLIVMILIRMPVNRRLMPVRITLLVTVAGAFGNIIDRIRLGCVIDFLSFDLIHFPVFNLADIYVTLSILAFAVLYIFYCRPGELEEAVLHRKRGV